ncbi:MAG: hypothetical protein IJZ78_05085 [Alistipes sp.]|nr:hypothetical protein [Alistipes sp.]
MKQLSSMVMMMAMLAMLFTACKEDTTPQGGVDKTPTVKIETKSVEATSAVFTITATDATEVYFYCTDATATAEDIKTKGVKVSGSEATADNLQPETKYTAYALAVNGDKSAEAKAEFTTLEATELPFDGYQLDKLVSAVYRTDNEAVVGNYEVAFGNTTKLEWVGDMQVFIDFYNEADSDPINPVLPSGTYEPNSDYSAFSYSPSDSYVDIVVEGGELVSSPIMGTVTVERTGPTYTITVVGTLILLDDMEFSARYTGTLQFVQGGTSAYEFFEEDFEVTAEDAQMRYWGGWFYPFADDVGVEMFSGEFDDNGSMTSGYYVHISRVMMPKYADYNAEYVPLADGVYEVAMLPEANYCQPYTIEYGRIEDLFGDKHFVGTYITYVDGDTKRVAVITGGTMTVESSGDSYTITADFVAENGVKVKVNYSGELVVGNLNDNDETEPERPYTTLTENHTYNFPVETEYAAFCIGEYMKKGFDLWFITIMAFNDQYPDGYGDMFTTEFLVEAGAPRDKMPTGTFNVAMEVKDHTMFPGIVDYAGNIFFTWYGDLTPDAEGYSSQIAPIVSGTVTVEEAEEAEEGNYSFTFDLVDDGGNKITGQWTGGGEAIDLSAETAAASAQPLSMRR